MDDYTLDWYLNDYILRVYAESFTLSNMAAVASEMVPLLDNSEHPLTVIWDLTDLKRYPSNVLQITRIMNPIMGHENYGRVITLSDNAMVKILAKISTDMFRLDYHNFETLDKAIAYLKTADPEIADKLP